MYDTDLGWNQLFLVRFIASYNYSRSVFHVRRGKPKSLFFVKYLCLRLRNIWEWHYCYLSELPELVSSSHVFPHGLPDEFTLIFTLALKETALTDTVYLFQISDQQGYPQVSSLPFLLSLWMLSLTPSWFLLLIDLPAFNHPNFFRSPHAFASSSTLPFDFFSRVTSFQFSSRFHPFAFCPFLFCVGQTSLSLSSCATPSSMTSSSPLSFTFIHIHMCSMMKHCSPPRLPIITRNLRPDLNT